MTMNSVDKHAAACFLRTFAAAVQARLADDWLELGRLHDPVDPIDLMDLAAHLDRDAELQRAMEVLHDVGPEPQARVGYPPQVRVASSALPSRPDPSRRARQASGPIPLDWYSRRVAPCR